MTLKTLYKNTTSGSSKCIIFTENDKFIVELHDLDSGSLTKEVNTCKERNNSKSTFVSAEQEAKRIALAKYQSFINDGYSTEQDNTLRTA